MPGKVILKRIAILVTCIAVLVVIAVGFEIVVTGNIQVEGKGLTYLRPIIWINPLLIK